MGENEMPPGCTQFAVIEKEMDEDGRPKVFAWGFVCGRTPRFETPKKKARREFLERTARRASEGGET